MKHNRYSKSLLAVGVFAGLTLSASMSHAATIYTWTGSVDGDWANALNWDANGVPVDADPTRTQGVGFASSADRIVINAIGSNHSPTTNVPNLYAHNGDSVIPTIDVINGSAGFFYSSNLGQGGGGIIDANISTTVGDGNVSNGLASLTWTTSQLSFRRAQNFTMEITVNSDGTLNFVSERSDTLNTISANAGNVLSVILAGGAVNYNGPVSLLRNSTDPGNSWFDFTAEGSSFTASFGEDFADLATVETYIGSGLTFRSTTDLVLGAQNNGDGTFTVSVIPEPTTALLGGLGLLALLRRRR